MPRSMVLSSSFPWFRSSGALVFSGHNIHGCSWNNGSRFLSDAIVFPLKSCFCYIVEDFDLSAGELLDGSNFSVEFMAGVAWADVSVDCCYQGIADDTTVRIHLCGDVVICWDKSILVIAWDEVSEIGKIWEFCCQFLIWGEYGSDGMLN